MIYFRTFSNIHEDDKILQLKEKFGMAGFGRYMTLLAMIAEKHVDGVEEYTFTKSFLAQKLKKRWGGLELEFNYCSTLLGLEFNISNTLVKVKYPKFTELHDKFTPKKRKEKKRKDIYKGFENDKKAEPKPSIKSDSRVEEVISYLNAKAGKKFSIDANSKFVKGRLKEKYTVDQLKSVIDLKLRNDFFLSDNKKLMRPSTLFSKTNFDNYLNELGTKSSRAPFLAE